MYDEIYQIFTHDPGAQGNNVRMRGIAVNSRELANLRQELYFTLFDKGLISGKKCQSDPVAPNAQLTFQDYSKVFFVGDRTPTGKPLQLSRNIWVDGYTIEYWQMEKFYVGELCVINDDFVMKRNFYQPYNYEPAKNYPLKNIRDMYTDDGELYSSRIQVGSLTTAIHPFYLGFKLKELVEYADIYKNQHFLSGKEEILNEFLPEILKCFEVRTSSFYPTDLKGQQRVFDIEIDKCVKKDPVNYYNDMAKPRFGDLVHAKLHNTVPYTGYDPMKVQGLKNDVVKKVLPRDQGLLEYCKVAGERAEESEEGRSY